ncbi:MAG: DUF1905 domain-containing protein [Actinomycetota bacterium]
MSTDQPPTIDGATFGFQAELWESSTEGTTWVFVTVPEDQSDEIADLAPTKAGFGSVRVEVTIGATRWRTSLFPDSKAGAYVLPLKKAVRTAEGLDIGASADIELTLIQT